MRVVPILVLFLSCGFIGQPCACGQADGESDAAIPSSAISSEAETNAALVWAGVTEWYESISAAQVDAVIAYTEKNVSLGTASRSSSARITFDNSINGFRFDAFDGAGERKHAFLFLPDRSVVYGADGNVVQIEVQSQHIKGYRFRGHRQFQPFDPRSLPYMTRLSAYGSLPDHIASLKAGGNVLECSSGDGQEYRLVLQYLGNVERRRTYLFDANRQFALVRMQYDIFDSTSEQWREEVCVAETQWGQVGETYVPVQVKITSNDGGSLETSGVKLKWQPLSEPVPPSTFEMGSLGLPDRTLVSDNRVEPAVLSRTGELEDGAEPTD